MSKYWITALFATLTMLGIPTYDERHTETSEEFIMRICGETGVGTVGAEGTLEDSE